MTAEPIVHIVEDDAAVRESVAFLLSTAGFAVRAYESAETILDRADALEPGCIVTDIRMPGMSGLNLIAELRRRGLHRQIIVITGHGDVPLAVEAMKAGARDFIEKPFDDETLLTAVRAAHQRDSEDGQRAAARAAAAHRIAALSGREREVLDGLVAGMANKVIAQNLGISPRTVEIYRANVMAKMAAASLSDLVRMTLLVNG